MALLFVASASANDGIAVVVYEAPKLFFSSPEHAPVLGGPGIGIGPERPPFGSDPGERFVLALSDALRDRADVVLHLPDRAVPGPKTTRRIENPAGARTLVVFTTMHFLGYRPMHWRTYQYGYGAYLRVVDADANTVLETSCVVKVDKARPELQIRRDELQTPGRFDAVVDRTVQACAAQVVDALAAVL